MKTIKLSVGTTPADVSKARIGCRDTFTIISYKPRAKGDILTYIGQLPASLSARAA